MNGAAAQATAAALVVAWAGFTFFALRRGRPPESGHDTGGSSPDTRGGSDDTRGSSHDTDGILVVHASQTGFATELASRTEAALRAGGRRVEALSIDMLSPEVLASASLALFIVSTTGEGDAPDMAMGFQRELMARPASLEHMSFGVLALGDRDYEDFCAFGRELDHWLRTSGARPALDRVDVDNGDEAALRHWQHAVDHWSGTPEAPDWVRPTYQSWTLAERELLNPGSAGGACYHVALVPDDPALLAWDAGDIVEIGPRRAGVDPASLPHREYSIASIPADGALHLVVRQQRRADGTPGLGSGWLTEGASVGGAIDVRVRRNVGFHAPKDDRPLVLIGNGTGVAGLRALLRQRIARGHHRNWMVFGERHSQVDRLHVDELERWRDAGLIERLDLVWSRDGGPLRYVQDSLHESGDAVRRVVGQGASIYVCGSLAGMAPAVDAVLRDVLGDSAVETLVVTGRYRRDVY